MLLLARHVTANSTHHFSRDNSHIIKLVGPSKWHQAYLLTNHGFSSHLQSSQTASVYLSQPTSTQLDTTSTQTLSFLITIRPWSPSHYRRSSIARHHTDVVIRNVVDLKLNDVPWSSSPKLITLMSVAVMTMRSIKSITTGLSGQHASWCTKSRNNIQSSNHSIINVATSQSLRSQHSGATKDRHGSR